MKKYFIYIFTIITLSLSIGMNISYASDYQAPFVPKPDNLPGPSVSQQEQDGTRKIIGETFLPRLAIGIIGTVGIASFLFLIIAGVRYATLYGNEEGVEKAKNQIIYALAGLMVALLSYTIVSIIINLKFVPEPPAPTATQAPAATAPPAAGSLGEAAGVPEQPAI